MHLSCNQNHHLQHFPPKETPTPPPPPGPTTVPVVGNFFWLLRTPFSEYPSSFRSLWMKHGPIFTLRAGSRLAIFIGTPTLAHQALVQNGAVFADRPKASPPARSPPATSTVSAPPPTDPPGASSAAT
ncbi:hypothetical protein RHSIM_Rhsim03G0225100 [Rhododendron simsii]|uniref:Cytochrome P450 n=1 Tax=Rhododendron simsii TaxID=118357 RepID=A0A834H7D8_RHOSS|nr:hypothetical protein RHSIM_Rhsim03G0225100 [Rhododendron simsii]